MQRGPKPRNEYSRFDAKIDKAGPLWHGTPCWQWKGTLHSNGYGLFDRKIKGRWQKQWAHRVAYEFYVRPLRTGETIDHLCQNHVCVNPCHLDPCPTGVNSRRSPLTQQGKNIRKTHCPQGHPYSGENLFYDQGKRKCRTCVRQRNRLADARRRAKSKVIAVL